MKTKIILAIALILSITLAHGDVSIGKYTFKLTFKETTQYDYLSDYDELAASSKEIVSSCEKSGDKKSCVEKKLYELTQNSNKLSWGLDKCQAAIGDSIDGRSMERDWLYDKIAGSLENCQAAETASVCTCAEMLIPDLNGRKIQFSNDYGGVLLKVYLDDDELIKYRRSISLPSLTEYESSTKIANEIDGFFLTQDSCIKKGYCDNRTVLRIVKTPNGVSFLKKGNEKTPSYCRGFSPQNHFIICAETKQRFTDYNPEYVSPEKPIQYRFALTIGSERKELKEEFRNLPVVIELENQIAKYEDEFDNAGEFEKLREYVLAMAFLENGFEHYNAAGNVEISATKDHGAMQINEVHEDCFGGAPGPLCSKLDECDGKTADDMVCNVAAGVYHYRNHFVTAKVWTYPDGIFDDIFCGGKERDTYQLALRFYNGFSPGITPCSYPDSVESQFEMIFDEKVITSYQATPESNPTNNNIYILGDSLTDGYQIAGLEANLKTKGYQNVVINGLKSRTLSQGLSVLDGDSSSIADSGTVVIALGTNPSEPFSEQVAGTIDKIKSINPSTKIYWVSIYYSTQKPADWIATYEGYNAALSSLSAQKGFQVISLQQALGQQTIDQCITADDGYIHPSACYGQFAQALANSLS